MFFIVFSLKDWDFFPLPAPFTGGEFLLVVSVNYLMGCPSLFGVQSRLLHLPQMGHDDPWQACHACHASWPLLLVSSWQAHLHAERWHSLAASRGFQEVWAPGQQLEGHESSVFICFLGAHNALHWPHPFELTFISFIMYHHLKYTRVCVCIIVFYWQKSASISLFPSNH